MGLPAGRRVCRGRHAGGAAVAAPAGLYLALSTLAFGVFVSNMVLREITERKLPLLHTEFSIFPSGNLTVPRPKIGPLDLAPCLVPHGRDGVR